MLYRSDNSQLFYRSFELDRALVDDAERTVAVSFSSETPYRRWFGDEILLHGRENVDMERLKSMGSALLNHNPNNIIGTVERAALAEHRGTAVIRFDDDADGLRAMNKVKSGSLRGVSVGYMVNRFREVLANEEYEARKGLVVKGPAMVATRWTPYEISLTPIPADATVGVGRAATRSLDGIHIERTIQTEVHDMNREEILALIRESSIPQMPTTEDIVKQVTAALSDAGKPRLRVEAEVLQDLLGRAGAVSLECKGQVMDAALAGKTEQELTRTILDAATGRRDAGDGGGLPGGGTGMGGGQQRPAVKLAGMSDQEFARMINSPSLLTLQ